MYVLDCYVALLLAVTAAAVLGPIHPVSKIGHLTKGAISLAVNGTVRQDSNLEKMIWSVAEQIAK